jgi:hypothetical protein
MKLIISFLLGVWFSWGWIEKYNGETFDLWTEAYTVGKDDGYRLGRSEASIHYDHTFQEKEAMCLFLYAEKGTVFGTKRVEN